MNPTRSPLTWPDGRARIAAHNRKSATFKKERKDLSVLDGVERVLGELEKLGVHHDDVIVSTNLATRLDGLPRSNQARPADPGAAVYWQRSSKTPMRCIAIDRYDDVADNLAAIAATLEAFRAVQRHGGAEILEQVYRGFDALPPPAPVHWRAVLELQGLAAPTAGDVRAAYSRLASLHHPDRATGSHDMMVKLNVARDAALKELGA